MTCGNAFGLSLYGGAPAEASSRQRHTGKTQAVARGEVLPRQSNRPASSPQAERSARPIEVPAPGMAPDPAAAKASDPAAAADVVPSDQDEPGFRPIDKSLLALSEPRRIRDPEHLRFVASHPCLVCGRSPAEAHHLRFAQPRAMSRRVSDEFTVPLCALHHRDLHARGNEETWWEEHKTGPLGAAAALWAQTRSDTEWRESPPISIRTVEISAEGGTTFRATRSSPALLPAHVPAEDIFLGDRKGPGFQFIGKNRPRTDRGPPHLWLQAPSAS